MKKTEEKIKAMITEEQLKTVQVNIDLKDGSYVEIEKEDVKK